MATKLEKELKRELDVNGEPYIVTISPEGLKLTRKGRRKGQELAWKDLVSGEAALAVALNASLGQARPPRPVATTSAGVEETKGQPTRRRASRATAPRRNAVSEKGTPTGK
jgi:hypothetical protein